MKCLQCGSPDIARNVRAVDRGEGNAAMNLCLEVYKDPSAWVFKGTRKGKLKANVCIHCGFVMFALSKADARMIGIMKKVKRTKRIKKRTKVRVIDKDSDSKK